jgi:RNA polymerase sigma factor FliA
MDPLIWEMEHYMKLAAQKENLAPKNKGRKITDLQYKKALKKYSILIRSLARKLSAGSPAGLDYDDFCSSGQIGLLDAMKKYDPAQKKQFSSYVKYRIRGAMLDEIRSHDWVPRSVKEKAKIMRETTEELRKVLEREPTALEVAKRLGLKEDGAHKLMAATKKLTMISTEDIKNYSEKERQHMLTSISNTNPLQCPFKSCMDKDSRKKFLDILHNLSTNERIIVSLYYFEDLSYKEIGEILNLTESRISQLHSKSIEKLQKEWSDEIKSLFN